jgi:lipoprotein NlpI
LTAELSDVSQWLPVVQAAAGALLATIIVGNLAQGQTYLGYLYFRRGDFASAALNFREAVDGDSAYLILWLYIAEARNGNQNAKHNLQRNASGLRPTTWPFPLVELFLGKRSRSATLAAAKTPAAQCEAQYYLGQWTLLLNKRADSIAALRKAKATCPKDFIEYAGAVAELNRLGH